MLFNPLVFGWSVLGIGLWIQRHWRASDPRRSLRMVTMAWALQWVGLD